jgi:hypothetical protein
MYIDLATSGLLAIFPPLFLVAARNDGRNFFLPILVTKESIVLFALGRIEKALGWS